MPGYWTLIEGGLVSTEAGTGTFAALPPLREFSDKRIFAIRESEETAPIGCIDVVRGFPNASTAVLGLLLISESHQRRGLGTFAFEALRVWIAREWPEMKRIRIGVVATNVDAFSFWAKLGFQATGERRKYNAGTVASETIVLDREIG